MRRLRRKSSNIPFQFKTLRFPLGCKRSSAREERPGPFIEPARKSEGPAAGTDSAPTPLPQQAAAAGCRPVIPHRGLFPGPRGFRPASPAHLPDDQVQLRRPLLPQKRPGLGRPLCTHLSSSPRGTENNGRERPALCHVHWLQRMAPGNSALLLEETVLSLAAGGRLGPRYCGRCSPPGDDQTSVPERS